jgi:hypothetical protein
MFMKKEDKVSEFDTRLSFKCKLRHVFRDICG